MSAQLKPRHLVGQTEIKPASLWGTLQQKWVSWRKKQMVGWYDPMQLLRTGRDVFISTTVGRHSDRRLVEALTADDARPFDYRGPFRQPKMMGVYLFISINVFGRHSTEALSSLRSRDWKNFLRLKIDKEGNLTIYPIGIRRVPRKWRERRPDEDSVSKYQPAGNYSQPELIEDPIRIR